MASKRSRTEADAATPTGDDFKLINSISWKMESRLHRAGITTFAQLGSMPPAEIASKLGNPTGLLERIGRENWIGQALELADLAVKSKRTKTKQPTNPAEGDQRYETFATELMLTGDNQVLHTRLLHVPSGDEELWGGWDDKRLINFLVQRSGLSLPGELSAPEPSVESADIKIAGKGVKAPRDKSDKNSDPKETGQEPTTEESPNNIEAESEVTAATVESQNEMPKPDPTPASAVGEAAAHKLECLAGGSELPTRIMSHDQPFSVRILLDLANAVGDQYPLDYAATVQVRSLTENKPQSVHYAKGKITSENNAGLAIKNITLNPGAYRLGAIVTLKSGNSAPSSDLNIQVEGGVLQVY